MNESKRVPLLLDNVVLVLDLDYTLAHYRDEMKGFFTVTQSFGIPESEARRALATAEGMNFSFETFYRILTMQMHVFVSEEKFVERATAWFKKEYVFYDDAYRFLFDYLEQAPVIIVTAGDEQFQREKIRHLDLVPHEVIVVSMGESKIDALKDVYQQYQKTVVFIDDNPKEIDRVAFDAWFGFPPASYRVRMRRSDSPYEHTVKDRSKLTVNSFDQLRELIPLEEEAT